MVWRNTKGEELWEGDEIEMKMLKYTRWLLGVTSFSGRTNRLVSHASMGKASLSGRWDMAFSRRKSLSGACVQGRSYPRLS